MLVIVVLPEPEPVTVTEPVPEYVWTVSIDGTVIGVFHTSKDALDAIRLSEPGTVATPNGYESWGFTIARGSGKIQCVRLFPEPFRLF
jgi:hypothetical protein